MRTYPYRKTDAFTSGDSLGNPAACLYLNAGESLTDAEMLRVAQQHKGFVSEVIYCAPTAPGAYSLTYFSSECEVDFCGHGTIACLYPLIKENPDLLAAKEITIHTRKKGALTVYNAVPEQDAVYITAPEPHDIGLNISLEEIADPLSLDRRQISASHPAEIIDAGLKTLIVPIASLHDEIHVFPKEPALKTFCLGHGIDIILTYSLETDNPESIAHTRVFAPKFGYLEDPATGSGNSAFGYYMLKHSLWDGSPAAIEQGGADRVFNTVKLLRQNSRVLFGGKATTRIQGVYYI